MHITTGYYTVIVIMFSAGVYLTCKGFLGDKSMMPVRYRDGPAYRVRKIKSILMDKKQDDLFASAGINMNIEKYNLIRKVVIVGLLLLGILKLMHGDIVTTRKFLVLGLFLYYLTYPKEMVHGRKTLFYIIMTRLKKRRAEMMDEELTGIIMQMKNIIISSGEDISANYILTRLIPFTKLTRKAFISALRYIRQGENETATTSFEETFGTKLGSMFANVLVKLDELPAEEFREQLNVIQKKAESDRRTRKNKKMTKLNTIRYMFALAEAFIIAGNFMYLIVIDSMKTLELLR
ncbi:hypothetical protein [Aminipila sp.]|uniref:hypothetical protein n=1 Tax=Aminipila sp. TaxID=2060095 RepID=UPI0028A038B3|nr:hypothetical protein [Aminipila sp.]